MPAGGIRLRRPEPTTKDGQPRTVGDAAVVTIRPTATGKGVEFATHTDTQPGPGDKGTVQMVIKDGNVGIGEPDPKHRLTVVGGVYCSGELDVGAKATAKELEVTGNTEAWPDFFTPRPPHENAR